MSMSLSRQDFARLLSSDADYLRIHKDDKTPIGSFSPGGKNRFKCIPNQGNFGVIPKGRLFILDVDSHGKGSSVEEQVLAFSEILQIDLEETFNVYTPSGGRHFYLYLPKGRTSALIPKASLRNAQKILSELAQFPFEVDADLRSGAALAYIVGPGSIVEGKEYIFAGPSQIRTISRQGYSNLVKIREESVKKDPAKAKKPSVIDIWKTDPITLPNNKLHKVPNRETLNKLSKSLNRKHFNTYHEKRAWVKAALNCCYDNDSIAKACIELHIDKDSATNNNISRRALYIDINRFTISEAFHGIYCPEKMASAKLKSKWDSEDYAKYLAKRKTSIVNIKANPAPRPYKGNHRVLDVEKISLDLMALSNRKKPTNQYKHALLIVELFLQPLANAGAERVMLSQEGFAQYTPLTTSQSSQALKILRQAGVVELAERQKTGLAPFYIVPEKYTHSKLTQYLRKTWGVNVLRAGQEEHKPAVLWNAREGNFIAAIEGVALHENRVSRFIGDKQKEILEVNSASLVSFQVASSYLRYEREWRQANPGFKLVSLVETLFTQLGSPADNLVEYVQLTGEDGLTPENSSVVRPGLRLRHRLWQAVVPPGLVSLEALGLGEGNYKAPANILPSP